MTDPNEPIFIGMEDGVAVYARRKNISGVDCAMQRDHFRRETQAAADRAMWDYTQGKKKEGGK